MPRACFNSETRSYKPGDFLIHFPGQAYKTKLMRLMLDQGHQAVLEKAGAVDVQDAMRILREGYEKNVKLISRFVKRKK